LSKRIASIPLKYERYTCIASYNCSKKSLGGRFIVIAKRAYSFIFLRFISLTFSRDHTLRDDYLQQAQQVITDPMILINVVSRRAKQLKSGYKPLIESLERLSAEDMALREIIEGKITYQLDESEDEATV
jgi:DNA-directed RNA polymerase subunit omega